MDWSDISLDLLILSTATGIAHVWPWKETSSSFSGRVTRRDKVILIAIAWPHGLNQPLWGRSADPALAAQATGG